MVFLCCPEAGGQIASCGPLVLILMHPPCGGGGWLGGGQCLELSPDGTDMRGQGRENNHDAGLGDPSKERAECAVSRSLASQWQDHIMVVFCAL